MIRIRSCRIEPSRFQISPCIFERQPHAIIRSRRFRVNGRAHLEPLRVLAQPALIILGSGSLGEDIGHPRPRFVERGRVHYRLSGFGRCRG
jgi:hypothetical protein